MSLSQRTTAPAIATDPWKKQNHYIRGWQLIASCSFLQDWRGKVAVISNYRFTVLQECSQPNHKFLDSWRLPCKSGSLLHRLHAVHSMYCIFFAMGAVTMAFPKQTSCLSNLGLLNIPLWDSVASSFFFWQIKISMLWFENTRQIMSRT